MQAEEFIRRLRDASREDLALLAFQVWLFVLSSVAVSPARCYLFLYTGPYKRNIGRKRIDTSLVRMQPYSR